LTADLSLKFIHSLNTWAESHQGGDENGP
jgi:hypothetical protein